MTKNSLSSFVCLLLVCLSGGAARGFIITSSFIRHEERLPNKKQILLEGMENPSEQGDGNPTWNPMFASDEDIPNPSPVFSNDFNIPWSSAVGAGEPRPDLNVKEVPSLLMTALNLNDFPDIDSGLKSMWAFSSQTTKFVFSNNMTDFIESAHETAEGFPTSFYGVALNGRSWEMEGDIVRVGGDDGWIATQVMKTLSSDGRMRRWQWELRMNRRPPLKGAWYVESIGSSDRKGNFEPE